MCRPMPTRGKLAAANYAYLVQPSLSHSHRHRYACCALTAASYAWLVEPSLSYSYWYACCALAAATNAWLVQPSLCVSHSYSCCALAAPMLASCNQAPHLLTGLLAVCFNQLRLLAWMFALCSQVSLSFKHASPWQLFWASLLGMSCVVAEAGPAGLDVSQRGHSAQPDSKWRDEITVVPSLCGSICFNIVSVTYRNHHFWDREAKEYLRTGKKNL
jgi:hypothetical protein